MSDGMGSWQSSDDQFDSGDPAGFVGLFNYIQTKEDQYPLDEPEREVKWDHRPQRPLLCRDGVWFEQDDGRGGRLVSPNNLLPLEGSPGV